MGRKNLLADLMEPAPTASEAGPPPPAPETKSAAPAPAAPGPRGAVGAMSRSLERMTDEIEAARALGVRLAAGAAIVELDPALIDGSFVADRMVDDERIDADLIESIRLHGQQVPILARPHPDGQGRYQVAYGHRRLRAAKILRRPVRAVVKALSDAELVVAQGQENSARRDLSFIERAAFAAALEDRGFSRDVAASALSVDKTELSRLISTFRALPAHVIAAIGPSPAAGRRRWMELAEKLADKRHLHRLESLFGADDFRAASSDDRFVRALASLSERSRSRIAVRTISGADGKKIARIEQRGEKLALVVDERTAPRFGDYLVARLPELYGAFLAEGEKPDP